MAFRATVDGGIHIDASRPHAAPKGAQRRNRDPNTPRTVRMHLTLNCNLRGQDYGSPEALATAKKLENLIRALGARPDLAFSVRDAPSMRLQPHHIKECTFNMGVEQSSGTDHRVHAHVVISVTHVGLPRRGLNVNLATWRAAMQQTFGVTPHVNVRFLAPDWEKINADRYVEKHAAAEPAQAPRGMTASALQPAL